MAGSNNEQNWEVCTAPLPADVKAQWMGSLTVDALWTAAFPGLETCDVKHVLLPVICYVDVPR